MALLGLLIENGPIYKRRLSIFFFFLSALQFITLLWPHVLERSTLIFHVSSLVAAPVDNWCHLISGSSLTRWSNLGLRRPHETVSLHWSPGASLSRQASSGWTGRTPVHVSSWKISHNPFCLTSPRLSPTVKMYHRNPKGAVTMWVCRCRWSPIGPSASRAEVSRELFANSEVCQEQWNVAHQIKAVRTNFPETTLAAEGTEEGCLFFSLLETIGKKKILSKFVAGDRLSASRVFTRLDLQNALPSQSENIVFSWRPSSHH